MSKELNLFGFCHVFHNEIRLTLVIFIIKYSRFRRYHDTSFVSFWICMMKTIFEFKLSLKRLGIGPKIKIGINEIFNYLFFSMFVKKICDRYSILKVIWFVGFFFYIILFLWPSCWGLINTVIGSWRDLFCISTTFFHVFHDVVMNNSLSICPMLSIKGTHWINKIKLLFLSYIQKYIDNAKY